MEKTLGLDLGTNSIGWAIRDSDVPLDDQIVDYGVVIFKKGVGEGKSGEYSLAAERRVNRSKRRLYNAKRYRKWATLKVLSENGMCPISQEELKLWSVGNWQDGKNRGRLYPSSPDFTAWIAMDFDKIGKEWEDEKLKPEYANIYLLRIDLLENDISQDPNRLYKIGRAFYHLVQRRGFKTSRKSGKSNFADNELFKKFKGNNPNKIDWKPSQIYQYLQSGNDINPELRITRIRNTSVIQRDLNVDELQSICLKQNISQELTKKIQHAIYYVRPLRTQKGLVGKCTLEKNKTRIPISHPAYEEFRALTFINNLQWRESGRNKAFEPVPLYYKKRIFEDLVFKKIEKGKTKGKVQTNDTLTIEDIEKKFLGNGTWELNYKKNQSLPSCPVIAGLMNVFDPIWKNKFIQDKEKIGINWDGLKLTYDVLHNEDVVKQKSLDYEEIWHLLFDYQQIKDDEFGLAKLCMGFSNSNMNWEDDKVNEFCEISINQGYGSLSRKAISKILPYLRLGYIYSEAVAFANLKKVVGTEKFDSTGKEIIATVSSIISTIDLKKQTISIVNGLIQYHFKENKTNRPKGFNATKEEYDFYQNEVKEAISQFGGPVKDIKTNEKLNKLTEEVFNLYLLFLKGEQPNEQKASYATGKNHQTDYYKMPRLDMAIKETLSTKFQVNDKALENLYHPSDIDIYPKAKRKALGDPNPPSKGWKNPMAMRTMYELKKLINFLLDAKDQDGNYKIDKDTKIVVEMARELNDANKRWAIEKYQKDREEENKEFAKIIIELNKEKYLNLNENDAENINKIRLWWEQLEKSNDVYKEVKALKVDVEKYKLWKDQECRCLYTGKAISIYNLFDGTSFDFEHTLPISKSFDNSFTNLTICDSHYNRTIKKNRMPTQLENYAQNYNGYPAIVPRIEFMKKKVDSLRDKIEKNKQDTKKAIGASDVERKNKLIKDRHLAQFELDYWEKKYLTFTLTEMPNWWKNSQLVDTQIISKYARAYLKSYFNKVDVQKGTITAEFRKIYGIMGNEKKDRNKHSHHAIDAAVLTLIPGSARREELLSTHYANIEKGRKNQIKTVPYATFTIHHVLKIGESVLINHVTKDQTLKETKKYVRKRGNIEYIKDQYGNIITDENGKKKKMLAQGMSIRGRLHQETNYGAIKAPLYNDKGFAVKKNGEYAVKKEKEKEEMWVVVRKPIADVSFDKDAIVDQVLARHLKEQIKQGRKVTELVDFNQMAVRHLRCRVKAGRGFLSMEKAIPLRKHSHLSKQEHKQQVYVQNDTNHLFLFYEDTIKDVIIRESRIISLFEMASIKRKLDLTNDSKLIENDEYKGIVKDNILLPLKYVIKVGYKVIFYVSKKEELKDLSTQLLMKRLFTVLKFNEVTINYLYLQNHIEAAKDVSDEDNIDTFFRLDVYNSKLKLKISRCNFIVEHYDFEMHYDGTISFKF